MDNQRELVGWLLVVAAITFWTSWYLMPDPGTTDTAHILEIVKRSRGAVLCSIIIQIMSSVLFLLSLLLLAKTAFAHSRTLVGISLLGVGAMGLCADAFFHLLAWFMTDSSVTIQQDVIRVMDFMQTKGLFFLVPLLLPFFAGSILLTTGLKKQTLISGTANFIFIVAIATAVILTIANKIQIYEGPVPVLLILGLFAAGQVLTGYELARGKQNKETVPTSVFR